MGYKAVSKMSMTQLARRIQRVAKDSSMVFFTRHMKAQMKARKICRTEVDECLRLGTISMQPEENDGTGHLQCRMERYICGKNLTVVVAVCDEDPSLILVTAFV